MPPKRGRRSSPVAGPSTPTKRPRPEPASSEAAQDVSALSVLAPSTLEMYLPRAKREVLRVLAGGLPPTAHRDGRECLGLEEQFASVRSALDGTVNAGEGNSVLLVGARGSGKSLVLESALRGLDGKKEPHVVRLDAALQYTDRLSMRELARQLIRLGALRLPKTQEEEAALGLVKDDEEEAAEIAQQEEEEEGQERQETGRGGDGEDGKEDEEKEAMAGAVLSSLANTTSTILSLLSNGANDAGTDARPLFIVLSSFELYTTRPRQALLYVLLDAVQAGSYAPGLAVVGLTSRLGVTDLLEKRVRSRFSGRVVNFMPRMDLAAKAVEQALRAGTLEDAGEEAKKFNEAWTKEVDRVKEAELDDWEGLDELVELTSIRDVYNSALPKIAKLSPSSLSLISLLSTSFDPPPASDRIVLRSLTSLEFALLVSARHLQIKGRETTFNFEMLLWQLKSFVARLDRDRQGLIASATPGQAAAAASPKGLQTRRKNWATTGGVSSGFADRTRAMMAFRNLISLELFLPEHTISSSGRTTAKRAPLPRSEFVYVRLAIFPTDIVNSVNDDVERRDTLGTSLVQWARSAG